ncbi:hypothetical protein Tco_1030440 [Tanacetum coccineum]|uniref:Uncharacterized protein n=1 Tax=Tanacetum coccineum TaxID=301880 RepID=A0ABQ5G6E2_9ASTR
MTTGQGQNLDTLEGIEIEAIQGRMSTWKLGTTSLALYQNHPLVFSSQRTKKENEKAISQGKFDHLGFHKDLRYTNRAVNRTHANSSRGSDSKHHMRQGFPGYLSPGIGRAEKLEGDTFPGDLPGRHRGAHTVSVKQIFATVEGFLGRHVARDTKFIKRVINIEV